MGGGGGGKPPSPASSSLTHLFFSISLDSLLLLLSKWALPSSPSGFCPFGEKGIAGLAKWTLYQSRQTSFNRSISSLKYIWCSRRRYFVSRTPIFTNCLRAVVCSP